MSVRAAGFVAVVVGVVALGGCGGSGRPRGGGVARRAGIPVSVLAGERSIGRGPRFDPDLGGPVTGPCRPRLGGRVAAHVELFAADHVVLIPAGVGTRPPRRSVAGRIVRAGCFGSVVTLDPTGVVLARRGPGLRLATLFRAWGQPLSPRRLASFPAARGRRVMVFVDGRRRHVDPADVALSSGAEIVLEVGPYVPPHRRYTFPPAPPPTMP